MLHILGQVNKSVLNFNSTFDLDIEQKEKEWRQEVLRNEIQSEENKLARIIDTARNPIKKDPMQYNMNQHIIQSLF